MKSEFESNVLTGQQKRDFLRKINTYHKGHIEEYNDFLSKLNSLDATIMEKLCSLMFPDNNNMEFFYELFFIKQFNHVIKKINSIIRWVNNHFRTHFLMLSLLPIKQLMTKERIQTIVVGNLYKYSEKGDHVAYHAAYHIFIDHRVNEFFSKVTLFLKDKTKSPDIDNLMASCVIEAANIDIREGNLKRKDWLKSVQSDTVYIRDKEERVRVIDSIRKMKEARGRPTEIGKNDLIEILVGDNKQKEATIASIHAFKSKYSNPKYLACLYYILINKGKYNNYTPLAKDIPYTTFHHAICDYLEIVDDELYPRKIYSQLLANMKLQGDVDKRCKPYAEVIKDQLPFFYDGRDGANPSSH